MLLLLNGTCELRRFGMLRKIACYVYEDLSGMLVGHARKLVYWFIGWLDVRWPRSPFNWLSVQLSSCCSICMLHRACVWIQ